MSLHKVIDAKGNGEVTLNANDPFNPEDYYAGGTNPITGKTIGYDKLSVTSNVDMTKAGEYTVVYQYTMQDGTKVSKTLTVKVVDNGSHEQADPQPGPGPQPNPNPNPQPGPDSKKPANPD